MWNFWLHTFWTWISCTYFVIFIENSREIADPMWLYVFRRGVAWWQNANGTLLSYIMGAQLVTSSKVGVQQRDIFLMHWFQFGAKKLQLIGNTTLTKVIETNQNKLHVISLWWLCITFVWPRGSKKLSTTAPSSWWERHLTVFYIDQIVPGFVVYYLNPPKL